MSHAINFAKKEAKYRLHQQAEINERILDQKEFQTIATTEKNKTKQSKAKHNKKIKKQRKIKIKIIKIKLT